MKAYQISIGTNFSEADQASEELTDHLKAHYGLRITSKIQFKINFALRELLNNAVEHGNCFDEDLKVTCTLIYGEESIEILVEDEGVGEFRLQQPVMGADPNPEFDREQVICVRNRGLWMLEKLGFEVSIQAKHCKAIYHWWEHE